ncbi:hypothetical protein D3C81_1823310 [compost metagenome]
MEINAPTRQLRHQREIDKARLVNNPHRGCINRHRIHLGWPAAVNLGDSPTMLRIFRRADLQLPGINPRRLRRA